MHKLVSGVVIAAVALVAPALALAHEGHTHHVMGTVSAITVERIDVKAADGTIVSCRLTPETRYVRGEAAATFDDVKAGERVVVDAAGKEGAMSAKLVRLGKAE